MCWLPGCAKIETGRSAGIDGSVPPGNAPTPTVDARVVSPDAATAVDGPTVPAGACVNLQCQQTACSGAPTSISGTVFAPNGTLPLFNVMVYVPNAPLEPFKNGVACDRCGGTASGHPIASAISNEQGKFTVKNAPAGKNIPLVFQVGKWRRKVTIANVVACQDNSLTDASLTRLPRNRQEGELPRIAIATGDCDQLGCLLSKLGVDPAEFGVAGDDKAVIYFSGTTGTNFGPVPAQFGPPNMRPAQELWNNEAALSAFDMTLLSCECSEELGTKSATSFDVMTKYLNKGGRIFGSHYAYVWYRSSPDVQLSSVMTIPATSGGDGMGPLTIDTSFPKGKAMADWMKFVDSTVTYGQIVSRQTFDDITQAMRPAAQVWASSPTIDMMTQTTLPPHPRILTVNTPVGLAADQQCGRAADLDAHIATQLDTLTVGSTGNTPEFPKDCAAKLTSGEEALAFLFFDLAACIQDDSKPVEPPIIP